MSHVAQRQSIRCRTILIGPIFLPQCGMGRSDGGRNFPGPLNVRTDQPPKEGSVMQKSVMATSLAALLAVTGTALAQTSKGDSGTATHSESGASPSERGSASQG